MRSGLTLTFCTDVMPPPPAVASTVFRPMSLKSIFADLPSVSTISPSGRARSVTGASDMAVTTSVSARLNDVAERTKGAAADVLAKTASPLHGPARPFGSMARTFTLTSSSGHVPASANTKVLPPVMARYSAEAPLMLTS